MGIRTCRWSVCSLSVSHGQAEGHVTQARRGKRFPALAFDSTHNQGRRPCRCPSRDQSENDEKKEGTKQDFFVHIRPESGENLLIT